MYGKLLIQCDLIVKTGLHIGASDAFSAIGAVDSPVIRDPITGFPIVPGSSLKGKIRTLLARSISQDIERMPEHDDDDEKILRLFGTAGSRYVSPRRSRLQFSDCFVTNAGRMNLVGITEVKFENSIARNTSIANPRQIERVTAGTIFGVNLVYDVVDKDQAIEDLTLLIKGMKLLQLDYLGGHGSRGSGRVSLKNFRFSDIEANLDLDELQSLFDEVAEYELFPD